MAVDALLQRLPFGARQRIRTFIWRYFNLRHPLRNGATIRIRSDSDWFVYNEIFVDGEYDEAIEMALASKGDGQPLVVLDLGANVGFFTARVQDVLRRRGGGALEAVLVEGSPTVFADLQGRLLDLMTDGSNLRAMHGLIGQRSGSARIQEVGFGARNTLFAQHNDEPASYAQVPYIDIEAAVGPGAIDLLKCDIEGSEESFLSTFPELLSRTRLAVFEMHPPLCDVPRCRQLLGAAGLTAHRELTSDGATSLELFWRPDAAQR